MKNFMMRLIDLANMFGLICGAIAIIYLGIQIKNPNIRLFGIIVIILFIFLFGVFLILLIRDFIKHGWRGMIPSKFYGFS